MLPTAVECVAQHSGTGLVEGISLKDILLSLCNRYQSAVFLSMLLDVGMEKYLSESADGTESDFFGLISYALQEPALEDLYVRRSSSLDPVQAEQLYNMADLVDYGLANDIRGLGITHNL